MFCSSCGKKITENSKFCKYCGLKNINDTEIPKIVKNTKKIKLLVLSLVIIFVAFSTIFGSVLAYSQNLKKDGDKEYKNQNYELALEKYIKAKSYWFPEKISYKLRNRDLETKINKANIMIRSGNNYKLGIEAFNNKNYSEAISYLSRIAEKDANFQNAQNIIQDIQKITKVTPSPTVKQTPISKLKNPIQIDCTGPDGKQFKTTETECIKLNNDWKKAEAIPTLSYNNSSSIPPQSGDSYRNLHCPQIIKLEDNIGLKGTFKKGDINSITVTVTAKDPQNIPLYYKFLVWGLSGGNNHTESDWSTNGSYTIADLSNAKITTHSFFITFYVDNRDGFSCAGGGVIDLSGEFVYTVTP